MSSLCTREGTGIRVSGCEEEAYKEADLQAPGPSALAKSLLSHHAVKAIKSSSERVRMGKDQEPPKWMLCPSEDL